MSIRRILPIVPALLTGAAFAWAPTAASAGGGFPPPPVLNCLTNVCTLLTSDAQDSDGDGFTDADEKAFGSDPYDATSSPPVRWMFDRIADETLPGFWLEPQIDLLTVTPDGHAITISIVDAMGSLGLPLPKRAGDFHPESMAPAGVDLGTLMGTLDWQVHGETTSSSPLPPDAPNSSLYGWDGGPPKEAHIKIDKGEIFIQNSFDDGQFTSSVQIYDSAGTLRSIGSGRAVGDPWKAQSAALNNALPPTTTQEVRTKINNTVEVQTRGLATHDVEPSDHTPTDKDQPEPDHDPVPPPAHNKEKKDHGLVDPDAGTPIDPKFLTPEQVEAAIAAGSGSYFTHVGDTGVIALVTPGDYRDPRLFIVHINPDADANVANDTPDLGGQAGPDDDPNLPGGQIPTGGTLPPGGTNS